MAKWKKGKEYLGTLIRQRFFHPFCECLGTFSTFNIFFFLLFYLIIYPTIRIRHVDESKRISRK